MTTRHLPHLLVAIALTLGACRKAEVTAYRVPKEKDPELPGIASPAAPGATSEAAAPAAGGAMASTPVATAQGNGLAWTAPAHWKAKAAGSMRKGSYAVAGDGGEADVSVTAFPNNVGGELANINRWRGQVALPPITEGQLEASVTRTEHDGLKFGAVDLGGGGTPPQRIFGAWVAFGGATWFFKVSGPDALVAKEKAAFTAFLATVKPATP